MRKVLILTLLIVVSSTMAYSKGRVRYGLQGGINLTSIGDVANLKSTGGEGFYVGFLTDINLLAGLYIQPGLSLSTRSFSVSTNDFEPPLTGMKTSVNTYYLSIPIALTYKFKVGNSFRLFVTGEPSFNFGVSGTAVILTELPNLVSGSTMTSTEYRAFDSSAKDNIGISNFDMGMFVGGGIEFKAVGIKAGYDFGLTNIKGLNRMLDKSKWNNVRVMITLLF